MNKVILIGNVGNDPEVKTFEDGSKIATFRLATTKRGYTTQSGTVIPDRTDWHNVVAHRGLATLTQGYIHKGDRVCVEGELRNRQWDAKDGTKRTVTEVYATGMELMPKGQGARPSEQTAGGAEQRQTASPEIPWLDDMRKELNAEQEKLPF